MNFDLGEVLTRTWKIGWNHKVLWLWQIIPGGLLTIFISFIVLANPAFPMFKSSEPDIYIADSSRIPFATTNMSFIFAIPLIFLYIIAQLVTTYGAVKVERGLDKLAFMGLFRESLPYFWRVWGVYTLFTASLIVIWLGFMAGAIKTMGLTGLCVLPFFFTLLIPVLIAGLSVLELAQNAIVADNMGVMDAVSYGWKLFRGNWLGVFILMIVLCFTMLILSMSVNFFIIFPTRVLSIGYEAQGEPNLAAIILFFTLTMLVILGSFIVQGISMAFFQTGWAVLYQRLNRADNSPMTAEAVE